MRPDADASPPPDVSIVVIGTSVRDEVLACLESVRRHAGACRIEAIYVDNASTDGSVGAVRAAGTADEVVALERNAGGWARNFGLRLARARYAMFLDSDALLTEGALDELVAFMDSHPTVGLVGPRLVYPDGRHQLSARRVPPPYLPFFRRPPLSALLEEGAAVRRHLMDAEMRADAHTTREVEYVIGACQLFAMSAQRRVGFLDERIPLAPEDIDWCLRFRRAGYRVAYHPAATVVHVYRRLTRQRPVSRAALDQLYGFAYFYWKWRSSWRALRADGRRIDRAGGRLPELEPRREVTRIPE